MPVSPETLAAFAAASMILLVIPGPTIIMVISQALAYGRGVAFFSVLGVGLGDLAAATLSVIGVGTILAASSALFMAIKWIGAAYLIWIGVKLWRAPVEGVDVPAVLQRRAGGWALFRDSFLVTLFNPKGIVFFIAFVPQFIDHGAPFAPQAAVLVATFVILGVFNAYGYVLLASSARHAMRSPVVLRRLTRTGALFLISAAVASVLVRRA
ncbi:MAG TPA: LysE family translocator [Rhizobiaceae bacterium]|nr:LysE family translocator [Rhizobiaceae bacterium]